MESTNQQRNAPLTISSSDHHIDEKKICKHAKVVVNKLLKAGYQAYLVGGCVRDLLLDITPKDFDVATNAHPSEICDLFDNSRLIGRRFRIVHVYFNREYIEVSTFRALVNENNSDSATEITNGRIIRDNTFGSIEEDALRRDFTVNAMYYDLKTSTVLDFSGGMQDIAEKSLRMIGLPESRYVEDPVRMLRAVRFQSKLDLTIEKSTAAPIQTSAHLLREVSAARLFDEVIKLFHSGHALQCFHELERFKLFESLFPLTQKFLASDDEFREFIYAALRNTDTRIASGKSVNPAFIFAVFLWRPYQQLLQQYERKKIPYGEGSWEAGRTTVLNQSSSISIPKRFSIMICEIWKLQNRFSRKQGRKVHQFMQHPRFRAAYDFMCLRAQVGELDSKECEWWTQIQSASPEEQRKMLNQRNTSRNKKKNKKKTNQNNQH